MKTLFILSMFLIGTVYAGETCSETAEHAVEQREIKTDVPKFLEGATIVVRLKNGKETSVPAEKFKVVPRTQQFVVTKTKSIVLCSASEKNRVAILGGYGNKASVSKTVDSPNQTTVKTNEGLVGGLQFQRKVSDKVSVGAQVQSNKTTSLIIGVDF